MYYSDQAIVLSRRHFRQDDLLVNVYTRKHGKVQILARGAKKIKSKMAGHIEPINLVDINWVSGKQYNQLTGAVVDTSFLNIKNDLQKIEIAGNCIKYLDDLTEDGLSDPRIFELTKSVLEYVSKNNQHSQIIQVSYFFKLLKLLGLDPSFNSKHKQIIQYVIKNKVTDIINNKQVQTNINELYKLRLNHV